MKRKFTSMIMRVIAGALMLTTSTSLLANEDWTELATLNGVTVQAQVQECDGQSYFVIRINNSSDQAASVQYTLTLADAPMIPPISGEVNDLAGGTSVTGVCGNLDNRMAIPAFHEANTIDKLSATLTIVE